MMTDTRALLVGLFLVTAGCSGSTGPASTPWTAPPSGMQGVKSGSDVERFFPLVDGQIYQYATTNELNDEGLLVARVFRSDPSHGELRYPSGRVKSFEFGPEGVKLVPSGAFVLKAPLQPSTTWRGENGGKTTIVAVNVPADVKAGHYEQCLQTLEERGGDQPIRLGTTFCPDASSASCSSRPAPAPASSAPSSRATAPRPRSAPTVCTSSNSDGSAARRAIESAPRTGAGKCG